MDEREGLPSYPDNFFDLAIVDPPYGIGISNNMGRRSGDKKSKYKNVEWDSSIPSAHYFIELRRISKHQIIWGGNYFTAELPAVNSWIVWHKMNDGVDFSMAELAWTNLSINCKVIKRFNKQQNRIHPTQKPVWLYQYLITEYAKPGDLILDTHVGSASSLIAFESMGFNYHAFEIDEDYYKAALERMRAGIQTAIF